MYICVHGCAAVYPRDSRTQSYLRMSWIYRARACACCARSHAGTLERERERDRDRVAEHEVYSLCHYRRLAEFRALSVRRYVMRMSLDETIGFASFRYRGLQSRARYVNSHLALAYQTRIDSNDELPSHSNYLRRC